MNLYPNTNSMQDLTQNERLLSWFDALKNNLEDSHQRACVMLRGPKEWSLAVIQLCIGKSPLFLSNDKAMPGAVSFSRAENLLGQEADSLVYDLYGGINSDVLCMAAGLIRSGGILLLLCPQELNPGDDVYGHWQGNAAQSPVFFNYLMDQWSTCESYFCIQPTQPLPTIKPFTVSPVVEIEQGKTRDQQVLIQQLHSWYEDKAKPLFLLTADRGRGKSTALGMFANSLNNHCCVVITAASRMQVEILLQQINDKPSLTFRAPDEIIRRQQTIDVLIIDEAAMLPASVLQQCIELAQKTILSTTTGGYEGTGQGFMLKFIAAFNPQQMQSMQLLQAVRWGQNDLLEQSMNNALLLKSSELKPYVKGTKIKTRLISKTELVKDLALLREIYQLLVSAHYRTRPSDLRQLMEDENQLLLLARDEFAVLGVLLLNREGGFEQNLSEEIFMGRRRPQGHLLAQMLTAQAGIKYFSCYQGFRVQRIAVEKNFRRKGLGRMLIQHARDLVDLHQVDYLGSSFALDQINAAFWKSCGFQLVHIASGKGKSSGRQTVVVLQSSCADVTADMQTLQNKIQRDLALWLLSYCNEMFWRDVIALLSLVITENPLTHQDEDEIRAFAFGFHGLDYSLPALQRLLISQSGKLSQFDPNTRRLLVEKILLNRSWEAVLGHSDFAGRKPMLQNLRHNISELYEQSYAS